MNDFSLRHLLTRLAKTRLLLLIHFDAFRFAPRSYLTAAKWWILRKRVRARGQFAPLLGKSHHAYRLWGMADERNRDPSPHGENPPIIALIDLCTGHQAGKDALTSTLQSLAIEGLQSFVIGRDVSAGIEAAIAAIDWERKPWIMPLAAGDRLAPGAAAIYRAAMQDVQLRVIYADDDEIDRWDCTIAPHFKPNWNSELFHHFDYLTGACVLRIDDSELRGAKDADDWASALVRTATSGGKVVHVHRVLHHRTVRNAPGIVKATPGNGSVLPPMSVIVPTRNRVDLLRTCLDGVRRTDYPAVEIIVVDNNSDDPETLAYLDALDPSEVRLIRHPGVFNYSTINNRAAGEASGRLLCLLNNDIEVLEPDWLAIMARQALREDVGAVGAQLLYPDGRIQHAGVVIGVGNAAGHAHRFIHPNDDGYFRRHALPQFTSAVTAACLVVSRDRFMAVGGLDEDNFAVAYNDVDLCLKLNQRGWQSLYEPRAVLIHHESVSRGHDQDVVGAARFAGELAALQRIWNTDKIVDPFHHPHLSRAAEQFTMAF